MSEAANQGANEVWECVFGSLRLHMYPDIYPDSTAQVRSIFFYLSSAQGAPYRREARPAPAFRPTPHRPPGDRRRVLGARNAAPATAVAPLSTGLSTGLST